MGDIGALRAKIVLAKREIEDCKKAINQIGSIRLSLINVSSSLGCVADSLERGIIIDGEPLGVEIISKRKQNIDSFNNNLYNSINELNKKIAQLKESIVGWQNQIAYLIELQRKAEEANANKK